jgi:hypothetical protein
MFHVISQYKALAPAVQQTCSLLADYIQTHEGPFHVAFDIDDTLIFDDNRGSPNIQVKHLLDVAKAYGCKIHLITAREKSVDVSRWTRQELRRQGIPYDTLSLAPKEKRKNMATISKWKATERSKWVPMLLTVGDQWGDIITIQSELDIDILDHEYATADSPWLLVMPNDGKSIYGLKLIA